jgi:hypothetical protein
MAGEDSGDSGFERAGDLVRPHGKFGRSLVGGCDE